MNIPASASVSLVRPLSGVPPVTRLALNSPPDPYTHLSPLQSCLVGFTLLVMLLILILGVSRLHFRRRRLQRAAAYVEQSVSHLPSSYNSRPLIEALIPRYFDVPDNLIGSASEPQLSVARLSWFLGMLEVLSPTANLYFGDLRPTAHPRHDGSVSSPEFWLDFEYEEQLWAVWFPEDGRFEVVERPVFSGYVSTIRRKRSRDEIKAWFSRNRIQ